MSQTHLCIRCERPTPDGEACTHCGVTQPTRLLEEITDMVPAARDVAQGQARRAVGGTPGKPGSRIPLDLTATAKLDGVQNELTTLARHIAEERGSEIRNDPWTDTIVDAVRFLLGNGNLEWLRHRRECEEALGTIDAAHRIVAGIARGPRDQKYLGPCGALLPLGDPDAIGVHGSDGSLAYPDDPMPANVKQLYCDGDMYGFVGAEKGTCRTCGATVDQQARRAWLDDEVRQHAFRASEIANAYGINPEKIRMWAFSRQARYDHSGTCVQPARSARLYPRAHDDKGRPLFNVGDVLDLAAEDAARRETNRNRKQRGEAA